MATRRRFASLTSRLVVTAVLLVAVVSLLIGTATALVMRDYLTGRLDHDVEDALARSFQGPGGRPDTDDGPARFSGVGSLEARLADNVDTVGSVITAGKTGAPYQQDLSAAVLAVLAEVPADGRARGVDLPGLGRYRVAAAPVTFLVRTPGTPSPGTPSQRTPSQGTLVQGRPAGDVDDAITRLVGLEALLGLLGVVAAGVAG
ncbi:MAG: hypothetical protein ABIQ15_15520, partial [Nocardioides sp.]